LLERAAAAVDGGCDGTVGDAVADANDHASL
jgi:hypothetical protein